MQKKNSSKDVFDELDRDTEEFKTAIKMSRQERVLKSQSKMLRACIILLFILAAGFIYLAICEKSYAANLFPGIMSLFLAIYLWISFKNTLKINHRKGGKA